MKTIILDFDDFSLNNNQLYYLDQLKRVFPKLKVSMFYIPFDVAYFMNMKDFQLKEVVQMVKDRLDWIELIPHGLTHKEAEFMNIKGDDYETIFKAIDHAFETYGLPYVKGFKAPQWLYKENLVEFLDKKGWWIATDRNQPDLPKTKKYYEYNYSIDEPFWEAKEKILKLHGHISEPSPNNLVDNIGNLMKIPENSDFKFISEVI